MPRKTLFLLLTLLFMTIATAAALSADNTPTLTIADINLNSKIVEFPLGTSTWVIRAWEKHVGHLAGTATFDNPGNILLAAHSTYPDGSAGPFYQLDQLSVGADITVFDGMTERHYSVTAIQSVSEYDTSILNPTSDERLTLITCELDSYDSATQEYTNRLVVTAQRVS